MPILTLEAWQVSTFLSQIRDIDSTRYKFITVTAYLGFCALFASAQGPYFAPHDYPGGRVTFIQQDERGFVWIGSVEGLYRFDGQNFTQIVRSDTGSNHVRCIWEDGTNRYWIGYQTGEVFQMSEIDHIELWQESSEWDDTPITQIVGDSTGNIWISTYGSGLHQWNGEELTTFTTSSGLADNQIYDMALDSLQRIWIATDNGVNICNLSAGNQIIHISREEGLPDEICYALQLDRTGMWMGFDVNGFCHYDIFSNQIDFAVSSWDDGAIEDLMIMSPSEILLQSGRGTLLRYDHRKSLQTRLSVPGDDENKSRISNILVDRSNNIWLVVGGNELYSAAWGLEILNHELGDLQCILEDHFGKIWVGTQRGVFQLAQDTLVKMFGKDLNVISLYEDAFYNLWIGTFGSGVFVWNPSRTSFLHFDESDGLTNSSILSIAGYEDRIWLATLGGISEIFQGESVFANRKLKYINLNESTGLGASFIYQIFVDSRGVVWAGSDGNGVIKIENEVPVNLLERNMLRVKTAYSFAEDPAGNIWIATASSGLCKYDGKSPVYYSQGDGLSTDLILSVEVDKDGNVIAVHASGIDILEPSSGVVHKLSERSGVGDLNPPLNSTALDTDGHIWIGGHNILVKWLTQPINTPKIVFDRINLFDTPIDYSHQTEFASKNNFFSFATKIPWFADPQAVSMRYKLAGNDLQWKYTGDQVVSYSKLSPGSYTFKAQPVLHDQPLSQNEITYSFTIWPPYWQRWWFVTASSILTGAFFFLYQRNREKRINREANLQRERAESQFELLKAQINPHFLFNNFNTLANIVEEDSEVAIEYIEKLSDYYRSIIQYRHQKVIRLDEELQLINNYYYLLKKRLGNSVILRMDLDDQSGFVPPLSLQMLVENAVKHNVTSVRKPLKIDIYREGERLVVKNNFQPKITKTPSTKFGLQNIKNQFRLLSQKRVTIYQTDDTFTVSLPILNQPI